MAPPGWRGENNKKLRVAFYCWVKGYFEKGLTDRLRSVPPSSKMSERELVTTVNERVQRCELPDYATPEFWEAVQMWMDWRTFGFPYAGGNMDQPALWMDVMRVMNECARIMGVFDGHDRHD